MTEDRDQYWDLIPGMRTSDTCNMSGTHCGFTEHSVPVGCDAVSFGEWFAAFQRNIVPSYPPVKQSVSTSVNKAVAQHAASLLAL
jgi:hypothetical protein